MRFSCDGAMLSRQDWLAAEDEGRSPWARSRDAPMSRSRPRKSAFRRIGAVIKPRPAFTAEFFDRRGRGRNEASAYDAILTCLEREQESTGRPQDFHRSLVKTLRG